MTDTNTLKYTIDSLIENRNQFIKPWSINPSCVLQARRVIERTDLDSSGKAFLFFASMNYLNACANREDSGFFHDYSFKCKLEAGIMAGTNYGVSSMDCYYNPTEDCLYVSFFGFVFSFYLPPLTPKMKSSLSKHKHIFFDGIRKQPFAQNILDEAAISFLVEFTSSGPWKNVTAQTQKINKTSTSYKTENNIPNSNATGNSSNAKICSFQYLPTTVNQIIETYNLRRIASDSSAARAIAIAISTIHFQLDFIDNAQGIPSHIKKQILKEIHTQCFSVIEAIAVAQAAREDNVSPSTYNRDPGRIEMMFDKNDRIKIDGLGKLSTWKLYINFRDARNNVHLTKEQNVENNPFYTERNIREIVGFMNDFMAQVNQECLKRGKHK